MSEDSLYGKFWKELLEKSEKEKFDLLDKIEPSNTQYLLWIISKKRILVTALDMNMPY